MSSVIDSIERAQLRRRPTFAAGDRLRVHFQVIEGTRSRTQVFDGVVIKIQGNGARETFTVRKQSFGVGVERTFPLHSPKIEQIEVVSRGDVRRAKLYYLRDRVGRRARVRERVFTGVEEDRYADMADAQGAIDEAPPVDPPAEDADRAEDEAGAEPTADVEAAPEADVAVEAQAEDTSDADSETPAPPDDDAAAPDADAEPAQDAAGDDAERE